MSRAWSVALLVAFASGSATAGEAPPPIAPIACSCAARYVVPEHELPVPTNAKVWVFGGSATTAKLSIDGAAIELPGQRDGNTVRFEPKLAPNATYSFAADWTSKLVTGDGEDHTPPTAPIPSGIELTWHTVSSDVAYRAGDLRLIAKLSDDTALVRITFVAFGGKKTVLYTTPHRMQLCNALAEISNLDAVWVTALDIAGNESATVAVPTKIVNHTGTSVLDNCTDSYGANFNITPAENYILALAVMLGGGLAVGLVLLWLVRRGRYDAHAPPEPVSLLVAERLVAGSRRLHGLVCVAAFVGMVTGITAGAQWLTVLVILIGWHVDGWLKARRAALLMANPAAGAELRGPRLTIVAHGSHASLIVSRRAVRAAKQRAVPDASAL